MTRFGEAYSGRDMSVLGQVGFRPHPRPLPEFREGSQQTCRTASLPACVEEGLGVRGFLNTQISRPTENVSCRDKACLVHLGGRGISQL